MKNEAVERIKSILTPEVTLVSCAERDGKIAGKMRHTYRYPDRAVGSPIPWVKRFIFEADKEGNIISTEGLF